MLRVMLRLLDKTLARRRINLRSADGGVGERKRLHNHQNALTSQTIMLVTQAKQMIMIRRKVSDSERGS